jgi:hypothetical protein
MMTYQISVKLFLSLDARLSLSFIKSTLLYTAHETTFLCHYDHVTLSPKQYNSHVFMNNYVLSIVSLVVNLTWFYQHVFLIRY